ncbi:hypothetical protein ATM97_23610 [Nocardia sp. MH4]|uniref:hypothetical protein n=1 Tax=Nocardia sp. MH4 TaxID=1768677 RepID=UPI001C502301|nr:hypothetical protein [Nocardia sp. MH4]MBW0273075.1 hypothetical protein [Nocardia sp. MH4]
MSGGRDKSSKVARTEGTSPRPLYPQLQGHFARTVVESPKPVWVRLDAIVIRDPGTPRHVNGAGLDMTGERPGLLSHWVPTYAGDWLGRVTYSIPYADGRPPLQLTDQLVPAYALRPRSEYKDNPAGQAQR